MRKEIKPDEHGFYSMKDIKAQTWQGRIEHEFYQLVEAFNNMDHEVMAIIMHDFNVVKKLFI